MGVGTCVDRRVRLGIAGPVGAAILRKYNSYIGINCILRIFAKVMVMVVYE